MGILTGSATVSRFNVVSCPELPDFDALPFEPIVGESEVRERMGFVPMEPDAPYQVGAARHAFRVRIDKRAPDPTAVKERVKQLELAEMEQTGAPRIGPAKRRKLRELAEDELLMGASPRTKIIEGVVDGDVLWLGTTAKTYIGTVLLLLRQVGVVAEMKAPWLDAGEPEVISELVETSEVGESVLGCRFLRDLVGDQDLMIEPESGQARLQTHDAKITLTGGVLPDLLRYVERKAEVLAAKLTTPDTSFKLDALSFRVSGLKVETARHEHWIELLDERLEKIGGIYDLLDRKYDAYRRRQPKRTAPPLTAEEGEGAEEAVTH